MSSLMLARFSRPGHMPFTVDPSIYRVGIPITLLLPLLCLFVAD